MNAKRRIYNIVYVVACLLLAGAMALMVYRDRQEKNAYTSAVRELQAEVKPYEKELEALESELDSLEAEGSVSSDAAAIMAGFTVTGVEDLSYIREQAEAYNFSPVLVIDCTMDLSLIGEILEAAEEAWEIMLYAPEFTEEMNVDVLSVLSYLESLEREHSGIFFLRSDFSSSSNIQLLLNDGFIGYTLYNGKSPEAGLTEDGTVYFDYSYLSSTGVSASDRLAALYTNRSSMIFVFDMESIHSGTLTEADVTSLFDTLQEYAAYDDCSFSTVADVVEDIIEIGEKEAARQTAYEERAAKIQERVDELTEIISDIYDRIMEY